MIHGDFVYCDCCGNEKLAEIVGDNLVIKARRHGQKHVAVVPIRTLLDNLEKRDNNYSNNQAAKVAAD